MKLESPNYFQAPNDIVDHFLPLLKEVELKVLLVICRKTFGWHKDRDRISLSQFEKLTGCGRRRICVAIAALIEKGIVKKVIRGVLGREKVWYELVHGVPQKEKEQEKECEPTSSNLLPPLVANCYPQKKLYKRNTPPPRVPPQKSDPEPAVSKDEGGGGAINGKEEKAKEMKENLLKATLTVEGKKTKKLFTPKQVDNLMKRYEPNIIHEAMVEAVEETAIAEAEGNPKRAIKGAGWIFSKCDQLTGGK